MTRLTYVWVGLASLACRNMTKSLWYVMFVVRCLTGPACPCVHMMYSMMQWVPLTQAVDALWLRVHSTYTG